MARTNWLFLWAQKAPRNVAVGVHRAHSKLGNPFLLRQRHRILWEDVQRVVRASDWNWLGQSMMCTTNLHQSQAIFTQEPETLRHCTRFDHSSHVKIGEYFAAKTRVSSIAIDRSTYAGEWTQSLVTSRTSNARCTSAITTDLSVKQIALF